MKKPRKEDTRWVVYIHRNKGVRLGTVEARDRNEALKKAVETFEIREAERMRLVVQQE